MAKIYRDAWSFMRHFWLMLLAVAIILEVLPLFLKGSHFAGELTAGFVVAYAMHRFFLFGEGIGLLKGPPPARKPTIGRFLSASLLISVVYLIVLGVLAMRLLDGGTSKGVLFLFALVTTAILYFVLLVIFGTALPAAAAGDAYGPVAALGRTGRTAGPIAGGLLVGPGFFGLLTFFGFFVSTAQLDISDSQTTALFCISVASRMIGFFVTALTVAVLCRAYRKVAPAEIGLLPQSPA